MLLPMKSMTGSELGEVEVSDTIFAAPINKPLMHQALVRQLSNARQGNHKTKTRSEVRGGGRKPWRQKGTGRARQGSTRAPNWVGGGTVFGPQPRKYIKSMPKKMQRAALRCALSAKAAASQIMVVDELTMEQPKTKDMLSMLDSLGVENRSTLLVSSEKNVAVQRSAHNLPHVKTLLSSYINVRDLLGHDVVVVSKDAIEYIEAWLYVSPREEKSGPEFLADGSADDSESEG